jgi:hypothetical protein
MVPELRSRFNAAFTPGKYSDFVEGMRRRSHTDIKFRHSETPLFLSQSLVQKLSRTGKELIEQLLGNAGCLDAARATIPIAYLPPARSDKPAFVQVDFGLVETTGGYEPRLVEIQGFPSLYAYQPALAEQYIESYGLNASLRYLVELEPGAYRKTLRQLILGEHAPENVVLLEIDPRHQKTLPDFVLTEELCGIRSVCITQVEKRGNRLFYRDGGKHIPIQRIYNRVIFDELERKNISIPFRFCDDLDVEWAGHPTWFYLISKFSLPWLRHPAVPRTYFLDRLEDVPDDLENWVLKPLYSFAGMGVIVGVKREDIERIPAEQRSQYILQERVDFAATVETPHGLTKAEIRMMYLWEDELVTGAMLVRMGRGKMMGVDHNRDMQWVGASAGFYLPE